MDTKANALHLVKVCLVQRGVRDGNEEGTIFDLEARLLVIADLGLITYEDYEHLMWILGNK